MNTLTDNWQMSKQAFINIKSHFLPGRDVLKTPSFTHPYIFYITSRNHPAKERKKPW
jgi:hypothetical protein